MDFELTLKELKESLMNIQQDLGHNGLNLAIDLKHDMPNEWHMLKNEGSMELTIGKNRFPYMIKPLDAAIDKVILLAKVENNPANFEITLNDNNTLNLGKIEDLNSCSATTNSIEMDTSFRLSVGQEDIGKLEDLILVVKYSF